MNAEQFRDYPHSFHIADASARRYQVSYIRWKLVEYSTAVLAAAAGAFLLTGNRAGFSLYSLIVAVALVSAIAVLFIERIFDPQKRWYRARAFAEAIKSETWKFVCGCDDYSEGDAVILGQRFCTFLESLHSQLGSAVFMTRAQSTGQEITSEMIRAREQPLESTIDLYLQSRILDQAEWYSAKSLKAAQRGRRCLLAAVIFFVLGLLVIVLDLRLNIESGDIVAILATLALATLGWSQLRRFETLAITYGRTASELRLMAQRISFLKGPADFQSAVVAAEAAISREHTIWISRGDPT